MASAWLQLRTPHVRPWVLALWFARGHASRWRCLRHWVRRARLSLALMEQLDLTGARPLDPSWCMRPG